MFRGLRVFFNLNSSLFWVPPVSNEPILGCVGYSRRLYLHLKTPIVRLNILCIELSLSFCSQIGFAEMERRIRMGPIEFISLMGGLFGLCLGFSFISFFEIIYWATIGLSRSEPKSELPFHPFLFSGIIGGRWQRIERLL